MNNFCATGNLGQDCRLSQAGNTSVCNFSVAVKSGYGDREQTLWIDCALWGKKAEGRLPDYLKKGQQVAVSGELSTREHEGKTYLQLRCNDVDLIGKRDEGSSSAPAPQQQKTAPQSFGDMSDEIPFMRAEYHIGG